MLWTTKKERYHFGTTYKKTLIQHSTPERNTGIEQCNRNPWHIPLNSEIQIALSRSKTPAVPFCLFSYLFFFSLLPSYPQPEISSITFKQPHTISYSLVFFFFLSTCQELLIQTLLDLLFVWSTEIGEKKSCMQKLCTDLRMDMGVGEGGGMACRNTH